MTTPSPGSIKAEGADAPPLERVPDTVAPPSAQLIAALANIPSRLSVVQAREAARLTSAEEVEAEAALTEVLERITKSVNSNKLGKEWQVMISVWSKTGSPRREHLIETLSTRITKELKDRGWVYVYMDSIQWPYLRLTIRL